LPLRAHRRGSAVALPAQSSDACHKAVSPSRNHHQFTFGPAPTLTIASSSLFVAAGGSVALPISVTGFDADDSVSVTIAGLPTFETITDALDQRTFAGASVSLRAAEVNSGLTLHSRYTGSGQPVNVLAVVATNTTAGESSTSPAQTIAVTDPPPAVGADNIQGSIDLLTNYMASAFASDGYGGRLGLAVEQPGSHWDVSQLHASSGS
jgi:hypothetical protein